MPDGNKIPPPPNGGKIISSSGSVGPNIPPPPNGGRIVATPITREGFSPISDDQAKRAYVNKRIQELSFSKGYNSEEKKFLNEFGSNPNVNADRFDKAVDIMGGNDPSQEGFQTYYMDTNEFGMQEPIAVPYGKSAPKGKQIESVWGSKTDDDNAITSTAKILLNTLPSIIESVGSIPATVQGLAGGDAEWYDGMKSRLSALKAPVSEKATQPFLDTSKIKESSDIYNPENWNFTVDNVAGNIASLASFLGELYVGGSVAKGAGLGAKATQAIQSGAEVGVGAKLMSKAPEFTANYMVFLNEGLDAAEEAGLEGREKYAAASLVAIPASMIFTKFGLGPKLIGNAEVKSEATVMVQKLINGSQQGAKKASLEDLYKTSAVAATEVASTMAKKALASGAEQAGTMVAADVATNASKALYDKLFAEGKLKGEGKYGAEITSPEALSQYINSAIIGFGAGALGGAGIDSYRKAKEEVQSKSAFEAVKKGETSISGVKAELSRALDTGKITKEEYDYANKRINHYDDFYKKTQGVRIDDAAKKRIFDLTWNNENIKGEIEALKAQKDGGPGDFFLDEQIRGKESLSEANTKEVGETLQKADVKSQPVVAESIEAKYKEEPSKKEKDEITPEEHEFIIKELPGIKKELGKDATVESSVDEARRRFKEQQPAKVKEVKIPVAEQHKKFEEFIKEKAPEVPFNKLPESQRSGVLADYLREGKKSGVGSIKGKIETGKHWDKIFESKTGDVVETGKNFYFHIGDKVMRFASQKFMNFGKSFKDFIQSKDFEVHLIEASDANLTELKKSGKIQNDADIVENANGEKVFKFKEGGKDAEVEYPYILQVRTTDKGIPVGNLSVRGGKEYDAARESRKMASEPSIAKPEYTTRLGKNTYKITREKSVTPEGTTEVTGELVVTDKAGNKVIGAERNAVLDKYAKEYNFDSGERIEGEAYIESPDELYDYIADNSNNPLEIIEAYQYAKKEIIQNEGDHKENFIHDYIDKITREDFVRFDDAANITPRIAKNYFADEGRKIDTLAQEVSEAAGIEVTEHDIVDFIKRYPGKTGKGSYAESIKTIEPSYMNDLRNRFEKLTGLRLTEKIIDIATDNALKKKNIDVEPYLNKEYYETEEIIADYEKQYEEAASYKEPEEGGLTYSSEEAGREGEIRDGEGEGAVVQKQKSSEEGIESSAERKEKLELLQKSIPEIKVIEDKSIEGAGQVEADGKTIKLNPEYNYADTPIHEFGHAFIDMVGGLENKFIQKGVEQLRDTNLWQKISEKYPELSQDMLAKEVLSTAVGKEGAQLFRDKKSRSDFRNWVDTFWMKIKRVLGIEKNVAKNIASQLLSGKKIKGELKPSGVIQKQKAPITQKGAFEQYENVFNKKTTGEKIKDIATEVIGIPRAFMTTMDMSAPLRQGIIFTLTKPKSASKAFKEMFRQTFSEKNYNKWLEDIKNTHEYQVMVDSGMYISDPHKKGGKLSDKEETFMTNLAQKIPLVGSVIKASERAYTSYLNKIRTDVFANAIAMFEKQGITPEGNPKVYKAMADFINNATGRGSLGKLEDSAQTLNTIFFSPRLIASRFNMLNPAWYAKMPKPVRKEAIKTFAQFVGVGSSILMLAAAAGAKVSTDPRGSDFGKIKVGDTRWDIWGGFQQWVRVLSQLASGKKTTTSGRVIKLGGKTTRLDVASDFIRGKLAPVPGLALELLEGRKVSGEKLDVSEELINKTIPIYLQDMKEIIEDEGPEAIFTVGVPSFFGVGVQHYKK